MRMCAVRVNVSMSMSLLCFPYFTLLNFTFHTLLPLTFHTLLYFTYLLLLTYSFPPSASSVSNNQPSPSTPPPSTSPYPDSRNPYPETLSLLTQGDSIFQFPNSAYPHTLTSMLSMSCSMASTSSTSSESFIYLFIPPYYTPPPILELNLSCKYPIQAKQHMYRTRIEATTILSK